jgi:hypothetical protein
VAVTGVSLSVGRSVGSIVTELQKLQREVEPLNLFIVCQGPVERAKQGVGDILSGLTRIVSGAEGQRV